MEIIEAKIKGDDHIRVGCFISWLERESGHKRRKEKGLKVKVICSVFGLHKLGLKRKAIKEEIIDV